MYKWIILYVLLINAVSVCLMYSDKQRARKHRWRISEKTLFLSALLGGSAGSILGMYLFHHKTKHWYFVVGMPVILISQLAFVIWILVKCQPIY